MTEWIECTLDKLGEIVGGATPSTKCEDYYGGSIPWITPKDLSSFKGRYITSGERNITEKGLASCSAQMMPKDAVLFTSRAPIGYVAIASQSVCTNQGFKSIVVNDKADPLFVYYLLKYNKDAIEAMGSGTTFKEVSGKTMRAVKVRIPLDVSYQKRIAAVLDSLDTKIENNERINDNFYMKALLDEGKTAEAKEYLDRVSSQETKYLKSFDSGNYAVDVVMNHEMAAAKEQGVVLDTSILVPRKLPFKDEDLCSLLSNLLDNAMEAASQAGVAEPTVNISIIPRQEYLFIRVTNPVDKTLPEKRRMTLETTKTNHTELHGYGTRIIRRIAESYNGSVKYSMSGGIFTTDVMLEMPEEKSVEEET